MSAEDDAKKEMAKLGQKALETSEKAGGWLDRVFGEGFRHLGAAFEDSMAAFRVRNRMRVLDKTRVAIEQAGMSGRTRPLDPRIAAPILDAISDESDETLQDVWASYIMDAVNPGKANPDRVLIDVIRKLEPIDWIILRKMFVVRSGELDPSEFDVSEDDAKVILERLAIIDVLDSTQRGVRLISMGGAAYTPKELLKVTLGDRDYFSTRIFYRLADATLSQWSVK